MREARLQQLIMARYRAAGWLAFKFTSPGHAGVPDLLLIHPAGRVEFAEIKTATGRVTPLQQRVIERLRQRGLPVHVLRSVAEAEAVISACAPAVT